MKNLIIRSLMAIFLITLFSFCVYGIIALFTNTIDATKWSESSTICLVLLEFCAISSACIFSAMAGRK